MTKVRAALVTLCLVVSYVSVSADVTGLWTMKLVTGTTDIPELVCALSQKGMELTGNCRAAGGTDRKYSELIDGRIEGGIARWQWKIITSDGEAVTFSLTGALEAKETAMKGTFKISSRFFMDEGDFTAAKQ